MSGEAAAHVLAGRYALIEPLGQGGAGTVWRARDQVLGRQVAVKQIRMPQDPAQREEFTRRAIHEARSAGRLRDPAIVLVHDVVLDHGQPWIVMDLATGRSLDKVIKESGPLPPGQVARIGLQVLSALRVAHAHGILHQDVKPANILLERDGGAMLTDFGIATPMDARGDALSSAGSPAYMAPERFNGLPAGPASDLWSLGASLYTAVQGVAPFERPLPAAVAAAVLMQDPPFPDRAGRELGTLIMDLLAKDPARRPTAEEVQARLMGAPAPRPGPRPEPGPAPRPARRRRLLLAVPAVAVLGAAVWYGSAVLAQGPETGRYATAPDPCRLLSDEQAGQLLGGKVTHDRPKADECRWQLRRGSRVPRELTVRVWPQQPQGEAGGPQIAARLYAAQRTARAANQGTSGNKVTSAVQDVPGVGEAAFVQDVYSTFNWRGFSTVLFRASNLLGEVALGVNEEHGVTQADRRTAIKAAQAVSKRL
ncbi:serine/threonine-protein kinase [Thermoactinospora rubra]|uniref:serine/threonine-protein kinase n=1 Tax=Thermoactinospora rubra TaxID=1088767 RepID=UPI000A109A1E|nr:serine/threonine-protein kinase [Thermoactinospora rubra]